MKEDRFLFKEQKKTWKHFHWLIFTLAPLYFVHTINAILRVSIYVVLVTLLKRVRKK
jgi:hypothetical protein